jgi:hypothetical protein
MGLPLVTYPAATEHTHLQFVRGPQNFRCQAKAVVHDNDATSGVRERVTERTDLLLSFTMPALRVNGDLPDWSTFMAWALGGGEFWFSPDSSLGDYYTCVSEDEEFTPERRAPGVYSASFVWRIVADELAPAGPGEVLGAFYGITHLEPPA